MGFIRVRSAKGPKHEYEVSEAAFRARPDVYIEVGKVSAKDATPVAVDSAKSAGKGARK